MAIAFISPTSKATVTAVVRFLTAVAMIISIFLRVDAKPIPDTARVFISLIERHDPGKLLHDSTSIPSDFWQRLASGNRQLSEVRKAVEKRTTTARLALERYHSLPVCSRKYIVATDDSLQPYIDSLFETAGFDRRLCEPIAIDHPWNSVMIARRQGGGFVMLINSGAVNSCNGSLRGDTADLYLTARIAREYSRAVLNHHLRQFYSEEKKSRRIQLWSSIGSLLLPGVSARSEYISHIFRSYPDPSTVHDYADNFDAEAANYFFPFDNEFDVEADIAAYRFMEWLGHSDIYIDCMRSLLPEIYPDFIPLDDLSDGQRLRIDLLEFMRDHPDLRAYRDQEHKSSRHLDPIYD